MGRRKAPVFSRELPHYETPTGAISVKATGDLNCYDQRLVVWYPNCG